MRANLIFPRIMKNEEKKLTVNGTEGIGPGIETRVLNCYHESSQYATPWSPSTKRRRLRRESARSVIRARIVTQQRGFS